MTATMPQPTQRQLYDLGWALFSHWDYNPTPAGVTGAFLRGVDKARAKEEAAAKAAGYNWPIVGAEKEHLVAQLRAAMAQPADHAYYPAGWGKGLVALGAA